MNKKIIFTVILVIYAIAMVAGAALEKAASLPINVGNDKILHFTEFFILMLILLKALSHYNFKRHYIPALLIATGFAVFTEVIQIWISYRSFSVYDLVADMAGILLALVLK